MTRLLLPLLFVAVAIGGFFKFTQPVLREIDVLKMEKAKLNQALDNAKQLRQVQDSLLAASRNIAPEDLDRLNKFLPDSIDNVRLIIDINNIARRSGMSIKGIKIKTAEGKEESSVIDSAEASDTGGTQSVTLGFSVTGPYTNFQTFLSDLARSLRLTDVEATGFSSSLKEDVYTYNVEIKTYWLK